ncbi:uncharacterized protein [Haliotis asinina]|uniref:uncharacterized protein n=1 Tax=Haliotis asinina TaxID=109174 RepID=UPI003531DE04
MLLHRPSLYLRAALLLAICVVVLFNFHILTSSTDTTSESGDPLNSGLVPIINQLNGVPLQRRLTNVQENLAFLPRNIHLLDLKQSLVVPDFKCVLSQTDPSFPICVYPPEQDKFISGALLHSGVWEPYITKVFKKALQKHPNAVVLDVGANIGYYSFLAAKMGHMVVAIEPAEENVWRFHKGAQLGRLTDVIYLLQNAMSDRHQNITLITNKDNQGGIRVSEGTGQGETTATVTMDDLLYLMRPAEVIIKIDIEGYECKAMAKSAQLFQHVHVPYIFMEWQQMFKHRMSNVACPPYAMQQLTDMLTQRGYMAHEVRTGIMMSPEECTTRWRVGDIYWRHQTQPLLFPPL